jgi:hypothetical protein
VATRKAEEPARPEPQEEKHPERESVTAGARQQQPAERPQVQFDDDDLDVPDFLK